jgi:predicted nucleic acid-binding protein
MNGAVETFLHGKRILSFDSMAIIYFIEENAQYLPILETIFEKVDSGSLRALSSYITLIEVLSKPISERRFDLVDAYRNRLIGSEGFTLFPVERQVSERAAHLRASYRLKTPDAIQIATAIEHGAEAFVTNEPMLTRVREIQVVMLGQFSS